MGSIERSSPRTHIIFACPLVRHCFLVKPSGNRHAWWLCCYTRPCGNRQHLGSHVESLPMHHVSAINPEQDDVNSLDNLIRFGQFKVQKCCEVPKLLVRGLQLNLQCSMTPSNTLLLWTDSCCGCAVAFQQEGSRLMPNNVSSCFLIQAISQLYCLTTRGTPLRR